MLDVIDQKLIELTQAGLPLCHRPYQILADKINIEEAEVIKRFNSMIEQGIIRRIAAVPNHYALGYRFNAMTVWDVNDSAIQTCGDILSQLSYVSHCYERPRHLPDWPYNLFAMIHGKSQTEIDEKKASIKDLIKEHCNNQQSLCSTGILKKTGFRLSNNSDKKA